LFLLTDFFEVVQYTRLFGGYAWRYRILLRNNKTSYDPINVYDRETVSLLRHCYAMALCIVSIY